MLNQNILKGKWKELKGEFRKAWGNITDDEYERFHGDADGVAGLVQKKCGLSQEEARRKINDIVAKFGSSDESKKKDFH